MRKIVFASAVSGAIFMPCPVSSNEPAADSIHLSVTNEQILADSEGNDDSEKKKDFRSRLKIWGFAEISGMRNFDRLGNHKSNPVESYPAWDIHLPNSGLWIELDCGKSWTVGTEMHFDNSATVAMNGPGSVSSRKIEWDMGFELSEFWIQKSFSEKANLKFGLISTHVGQESDLPTDYLGVIRAEDAPSFLPLGYSAIALDFNGIYGNWGYEIMAVPGLTGYDFGNSSWRYMNSSFEQSLSRLYGGVFRLSNTSIKGLELTLSGQFGAGYTIPDDDSSYKISNGVSLAALSYVYTDYNIISHGSFQYGYISNHCESTVDIPELRYDLQGMSAGFEVGYDMFSLNSGLAGKQKLFLFGRYSWNQHQNYKADEDSYQKSNAFWESGQRFSFGVDWFPIPSIIIKGECGFGFASDPTRCFAGISIGWCP